jgi:hypothetical protein
MGLFRNLYMIAKEAHEKHSMDRTVQIFKENKGNELYWQQLLELIAQAQHWGLAQQPWFE